MAVELDKDLSATMTPEELEAINAEESPEEKLIMRQQEEADADDDEDDDEPVADSAAAPVVAAEPAKKDESPAAIDPTAEDAPAETELKPRFQAKLPEDFDAQVASLNEETKALAKQFKDGEVDFDAYSEQLQALNERRDSLTALRVKADVLGEINVQTERVEQAKTVDRFMADAAKSGVDYRKNPQLHGDLVMFVERLENMPEHADKGLAWLMNEAHRRVRSLHGIGETGRNETKPDPVKEAKDKRKPDLDAVPKTLSQVPGGEGPGDISDEFADLDSLDGLEFETALAKLTPAQRDRYLKAA